MPFCPNCEYEYRPDITRCPDCDVDLVDELPQETHVEAPPAVPRDPVVVATFLQVMHAQEARLKLESQGIPAQLSNEILALTGDFSTYANQGVRVVVSEQDAARAIEILQSES